MHSPLRARLATLTLASLVAIASTACVGPHRYYDAQYGDYHEWNGSEVGYYGRWEGDTHRDHIDFGNRDAGEQREYFSWRHNQH
jgi:hypothetical protein